METRKHLPRAILARIYFIDREIAAGKYPNVHDLAGEYEVGTATIYRDIEYMRDSLNAPIEYSAKERGWYYTQKTFRLPARFAAADDMLALGMAKSLVSLYKNTPLYEPAVRLLNDITAPLSPDDNEDGERTTWYEKRIIVPPVPSAPVKPETWNMIVDAMKENRVIAFEYNGYFDDDYKTRLVRPYQLLFDTGAWFLYGHAEERSAIRIFSLSRMKNVSITNESFSLPKDFDYCTQNDGSCFGIFTGEKRRFKIAFNEFVAKDIRDRLWAKDQKITEQKDDEGIIIEFTSTQYDKVLSWVLSFGSEASPIEPPELVEQWKENILELYECVKG
ncbi:MAG: WYL domain-containing protein [Spirochaetaceae bacterium]|jgi:predicted DNA-binding transcriptional regulator YafY|nr:WYL domain-containing protein [Spirochaetaceae bacterium]